MGIGAIEKLKQVMCISCQECCKKVVFPVYIDSYPGMDRQSLMQFYKVRGFKIISKPSMGDDFLVVIDSTCPQLTPQGCQLYATRPKLCQLYNGTKDPSVNCKWKELETKEVIPDGTKC